METRQYGDAQRWRRANMETRKDRNSQAWKCAKMETHKNGNAQAWKRANMEMRLKNLDRFLRLAPPDCRLICGLGVRPEGKEQLPSEARHADTRDQTHDTAGHDGARNERSLCQTLVELKWALLSRS